MVREISYTCLFLLFSTIHAVLSAKISMLYLEKIEIIEVSNNMVKAVASVSQPGTINLNFTLLMDLASSELKVDLFALQGKEYRPVPIKIKRDMCDIFQKEYKIFAEDIKKHGHMPDSCPIKKGNYYLKDFKINADKLGSFRALSVIPWKNILLRIGFITDDQIVSVTDLYVRVNKLNRYKKFGL